MYNADLTHTPKNKICRQKRDNWFTFSSPGVGQQGNPCRVLRTRKSMELPSLVAHDKRLTSEVSMQTSRVEWHRVVANIPQSFPFNESSSSLPMPITWARLDTTAIILCRASTCMKYIGKLLVAILLYCQSVVCRRHGWYFFCWFPVLLRKWCL